MNVADTQSDGRGPGRPGRPDPSGARERLTVGSLFSGIGGFDLGFERAGMRTVWFCEQDEFCRAVLAKHWPGVPCYPDVRALVADTASGGGGTQWPLNGAAPGADDGAGGASDGGIVPVPVPYVDVLCGGFPCQDISLAGKGAGIGGSRSGLWGEFARLIGELRPRYVVVENVPAITSRGLDVVLADLAACGFDAEWDHIPASAVGAPHRRDRFWLVAYPDGTGRGERRGSVADGAEQPAVERGGEAVGDPDGVAGAQGGPREGRPGTVAQPGEVERTVGPGGGGGAGAPDEGRPVLDPGGGRHGPQDGQVPAGRDGAVDAGWWAVEPDVGRVAHGIPHRVERLRALGNSLVPQIAEWIGRRIVQYESEEKGT